MKILYVITSSDTGGAEQGLVSLVRIVSKKNTVRVLSLKPLGALAKAFREAGAELVSLNMTGAGLGTVAKLVRQIESFQPDIVHALLFRAIEFSRLACAGRKQRLITTPHFDLSQKPVWMRWLDRTLKNIDTLSTAESISTYEYLLRHQHYDPKRTVLIGNSIEKSLFFKDNSIRDSMRSAHGFTEEEVVFMCVARLVPVKNQSTLLRAFFRIIPSCPHAKLVFVGGGKLYSDLQKQIKERNLEKHVLLVGEQHNINDWLNMADVFTLISVEESLPLTLLEAQQVGLPCLVSQVGDMPKQVTHGQEGFVCNPKDEVVISCLLAELYENSKLRKIMGEKSAQRAKNAVNSSQQYQQFYQQIVN